jgi:hypothetical protein
MLKLTAPVLRNAATSRARLAHDVVFHSSSPQLGPEAASTSPSIGASGNSRVNAAVIVSETSCLISGTNGVGHSITSSSCTVAISFALDLLSARWVFTNASAMISEALPWIGKLRLNGLEKPIRRSSRNGISSGNVSGSMARQDQYQRRPSRVSTCPLRREADEWSFCQRATS